ncbi:MAG: DUF131 domain-containing protein [Thaumarchaeota archaeon]|nr:DUF131 domain-containing protein [Nitrososphaerota archaeon]
MQAQRGNIVQQWGLRLFLIGFLTLFVGITLIAAGDMQSNIETSFGGVIFIGPIPIVFGQGPQSPFLLIIVLMIAIVMALMFLSAFLSRKRMVVEE